jgi:DNA-binding NarL/FixJ family response regulator
VISVNGRPTIVVAEDHPAMRAEISSFLESRYEIVAAVENGKLALQAINEHLPDIAVLDICMPGMSGIEAARHLRDTGSKTSIVFLTVQADPDYIQAAEALGADVVLKPRMRSDLLPAIRRALESTITNSVEPQV